MKQIDSLKITKPCDSRRMIVGREERRVNGLAR